MTLVPSTRLWSWLLEDAARGCSSSPVPSIRLSSSCCPVGMASKGPKEVHHLELLGIIQGQRLVACMSWSEARIAA